MNFIYHDGGRRAAGFKHKVRDCVCRSIAIATGLPYQAVYDDLNSRCTQKRTKVRYSPSKGIGRIIYDPYLKELGWVWVPLMRIWSGCVVHMRADELPKGRLIVRLSRHMAAVIDGEVYDIDDPTRQGTRCVYGYFHKPSS